MDDGWKINQRLVHLQIVAKCLTWEELAIEFTSVHFVNCGIATRQLIVAMKVSIFVNEVAV